MLLPNKLFSYRESALALMPEILTLLDDGKTANQIAAALSTTTDSPTRVIDALDCLYALGRIDLSDDGKLHLC